MLIFGKIGYRHEKRSPKMFIPYGWQSCYSCIQYKGYMVKNFQNLDLKIFRSETMNMDQFMISVNNGRMNDSPG